MLGLVSLFLFVSCGASAREAIGSACSISNNHLDANTKEFITDCDSFGCEWGRSPSRNAYSRLLHRRDMQTSRMPEGRVRPHFAAAVQLDRSAPLSIRHLLSR
jgi:hypothetical protein